MSGFQTSEVGIITTFKIIEGRKVEVVCVFYSFFANDYLMVLFGMYMCILNLHQILILNVYVIDNSTIQQHHLDNHIL